MRFQVPQFIEHEPKVIGPFTFRQFVYLGVPGAVAFFLYFLAPFPVFIISTVMLLGAGFSLAFVKVGGRTLPSLFLNFFQFTLQPKRYIWKKGQISVATPQPTQQPQAQTTQEQPAPPVGLTQKSRVKDLAIKIETQK